MKYKVLYRKTAAPEVPPQCLDFQEYEPGIWKEAEHPNALFSDLEEGDVVLCPNGKALYCQFWGWVDLFAPQGAYFRRG